MTDSRRGLAGLLLLALAALAAGCGPGEAPPVLVGTIEWDRHVLIAERSEPVRAVRVREGDPVRAGDVLLELDRTRTEAQLAQRRAVREQAAARLNELVRGPRPEAISEAEAVLAAREAELENAEVELGRVQRLFEDEALPRSELDRARAVRDRLRAQRTEAAARLASLLEGTTLEELEQARAALRAAESAEAEVRVNLDRLTITAPVDGLVEALPYRLGEQPPAGAGLAVLLASQAPYARIYVPETLRVHVRAGQEATVYIDGLDAPLTGRVRFVASESAFTPYFALTERDRGRLSYRAEVLLDPVPASPPPSGLPVEVRLSGLE